MYSLTSFDYWISCFQVGQIDRHRILDLFSMFYDKAESPIKETLRNPRRCMYCHYKTVRMRVINLYIQTCNIASVKSVFVW